MRIKITKNQELEIIKLYKEGKKVKEISKIIGIKWIQPVTNTLRRHGFGDFSTSKRKDLNSKDNIDSIIEMRNGGMTPFAISKVLGLYHQFVSNVLKRYEFPTPPREVYYRSYTVNEEYFDSINSEQKAYIIGYICADGYLGRGGIHFCISSKDIDILKKIKLEMNSDAPITLYQQKRIYKGEIRYSEFCNLRINSVKLVKALSFIAKDKTYSLSSDVINHIPTQFIRDFLRGFFDGDGCAIYGKIYKRWPTYLINVCGIKEFLENTFNKYYPSSNKMCPSKKCHIWSWIITSKEKVADFLKYLYKDSNIYLDRKFEIYKCAHIKPIELLETQENWAISSQALENSKEGSETIETPI